MDKELNEYKPIRLVKREYIPFLRGYGEYQNKCNYDFCKECYKRFERWISKHKE